MVPFDLTELGKKKAYVSSLPLLYIELVAKGLEINETHVIE